MPEDGCRFHLCRPDDMHPYNCLGPGQCIHCDRRSTPYHRLRKCFICLDDAPYVRAARKLKRLATQQEAPDA